MSMTRDTEPRIDVETLGTMRALRTVVFSLGANLGDTIDTLQGAVDLICETPGAMPVGVSPVYLTTPVGKADQPDFHNLVLVVESTLEPRTLLERGLAIEDSYGRERLEVNGPRVIDVDLIQVGHQRIDEPDLKLPHPRAFERAFVLVPWADVEPDAELEGRGPIADLLSGMDTSGVRKVGQEVTLS
ncbi:2-amino-4-hydroxy-6-hydroxymethyldihydropteridine diphosphokinase [Acidipropionibacterium jensenii]|uniref:2-amino-4-hydroxy-6-hydroxymethyldihydropteridine diphosphokinase n=1 Tax=Acidipropionibacterium jensenii TaxID=1749 RepID=A0A3Q9UNV6_9ACTN|nr:2-amino-4-hydroxy-6-hydroxymethyldihydropteridine diphosphokinase [Acidipropionibacterium jensenii]AZZ38713.1 2-amino-4-hydroxy-6-hydroxymethyldihydropteridine diphosphokinase [Acidipropionibacterium jensenii]AZZ41230.1 2-amino-4-hydroxy-6-hydroxymethyldihydropteridine diphosphokinase [Acidipropionibacterium jensenii]